MSEASHLLELFELVHIPLPFLDTLEWAVAKAIASDKKLEKAIPLQTVQTAEMQPTQFALDQKKVNQLARDKQFNGALVFKRRGYHVFDGHHRLSSAEKVGQKTIRARVIELPEEKPATLNWFAKKLGMEARDIWQAMDSSDRAIYEKDL